MTVHRVGVADQDVAYVESAGTGRPVVLLHGNSTSARVWQPLLAGPFGQRFRCLALDLPGHGASAAGTRPEVYSVPGYAEVLTAFAKAASAEDAVVVGWSLGGHIALEAAPALPAVPGFAVFGTPPVATAADLGTAFLPNPLMNTGFTAEVDAEAARAYARSFLAPESSVPVEELVEDILATDGAARAGLAASLGTGHFADEAAIAAGLTRPLAVFHGELDQLVSLEYLRGLTLPTLWRGAVQVLPGVGHAPQLEAPDAFAEGLTQFIDDLG